MKFLISLGMILILGFLPVHSVFKYNPSSDTQTIDGDLLLDEINVREVKAKNISASSFLGDASAMTNKPVISAGGWIEGGNQISLANPMDLVRIGNIPGFLLPGKLAVGGKILSIGAAVKIDPGHSIGPVVESPNDGGIFFENNGDLTFSSKLDFAVKMDPNAEIHWLSNQSLPLMGLSYDGSEAKLAIAKLQADEALDVNGDIRAFRFVGDGSGLTNLYPTPKDLKFECRTVTAGSPSLGGNICNAPGEECVQASNNGVPVNCENENNALMARCCKAVLI